MDRKSTTELVEHSILDLPLFTF